MVANFGLKCDKFLTRKRNRNGNYFASASLCLNLEKKQYMAPQLIIETSWFANVRAIINVSICTSMNYGWRR